MTSLHLFRLPLTGEILPAFQLGKSRVRPNAKRGTIKTMRWKSAFTVLLAVTLLSASSWAAACDVACAVQGVRPGCHLSEAASQEHHLDSMSHAHCAHMRRPESATKAMPASFDATSSCTHAVCRQPDSLADPAKSVQFDRVRWTIVHQVLIAEQGFTPSRFVSEAPPPLIVPSFNSLSVALRI
jgi:hypothetical protein